MRRDIYIDNIDVEEAKELYYKELDIKGDWEEISLDQALDRISYEAIYAKVSSPNYNAAAMDGIAVRAEDTVGASQVRPQTLIEKEDFIYINTGNQIHPPYDAVIMIEDVIDLQEGKVQILKAAHPWQDIRQIGEDIIATEMVIPSRHKIRPIDIGALISAGIESLKVYKKPRIGILPTGSEIIQELSQLEDGKIMDSNSRVFQGEVIKEGGLAKRYAPMKDDFELLKEKVLEAVDENDMVLINAGSSAGTMDYTVDIIRALGQVIVHGVAMKPGKPTILGIIKGKPVIGLPGYPVSSYLVFDKFARPLIGQFLGQEQIFKERVEAQISKKIHSSLKNEELVRVNLGFVNNRLIATPLASGAGVTMSLVKADGIGIIPRTSEGLDAGDKILVELLKPMEEIRKKLVSIGSHDLIMDILADMMELSSGHVGSMGGIMAMRRGECQLAPIHLLDEDSGQYNISYVERFFPGQDMVLIKGLKRLQGLIVPKGNPEKIEGFKDLTRENIVYVNRQRGAGTRILLDYYLNKEGINAEDIIGYEREFSTHMAVATAVKTGTASAGLGVYSAAQALDLDFIPLAYEDYDFLIAANLLKEEQILTFIDILKSEEFKEKVMSLGGYKFENTGQIIEIRG